MLYSIDKDKILSQPKFVNGGDAYGGNCGSYDLENMYYCFGMVLTRSDNWNGIKIRIDIDGDQKINRSRQLTKVHLFYKFNF